MLTVPLTGMKLVQKFFHSVRQYHQLNDSKYQWIFVFKEQ